MQVVIKKTIQGQMFVVNGDIVGHSDEHRHREKREEKRKRA